jgi:predicted nucleic acid-binding protein
VLYLDASAIVKLARREPETPDLVDAVRRDPALVSSVLSWTEVVRAVRRAGGDTARAEAVLGGVALVPIDDGIVRAAADMEPATLRSLDAIHLATVLTLADDLDRLVTYDARLADAASGVGIDVAAPGATPA